MPQLVIGKPLVPSLSKLTDANEIRHYWASLMKDWGVRWKTPTFPGCNPVSVSREMLGRLHSHDYSITLKSDGVRYVLYCTTRPGSTAERPLPVALMIDRAQNMYEVDVIGQEDFFLKRTILEGELVWRQPGDDMLLFLVFDCVRSKGESLMHRPFAERSREAERCVRFSEELSRLADVEQRALETDNLVMMQYQPSLLMRAKIFVAVSNAGRLWADRADVEHRVDGIILQRSDAAYTTGTATHGEVLKWKPKSTVDLAGPNLRAADGAIKRMYFNRSVEVSAESTIRPLNDDDVLEYMVIVTDATIELFAMRRRIDKKSANGLRVVQATIADAIENIQADELAPGTTAGRE
jgi:hypothetical protein